MSDRPVLEPRKTPCASCPYRRDVPSGVWSKSEYDKLRGYDGEIHEQAMAGATGVFSCHQGDDRICAGWTGCHDMSESLAVRLASRTHDVGELLEYETTVPLFASGAEAADHGEREIEQPSQAAKDVIEKIVKVRRMGGKPVNIS